MGRELRRGGAEGVSAFVGGRYLLNVQALGLVGAMTEAIKELSVK